MRKFTINCDFGGQMAPFAIFIGTPKEGNHPLEHQSKWLTDNRGGTIPPEIMDAITKLQDLAKKNNVPLEDLCVYALGTEEEQAALAEESGLDVSDDDSEIEQADQNSIEADNYGEVEDMADEGAPVVDEELEEEDQSFDDQDTAAEDMADEGAPIVDEELESDD